MYRPFWIGIEPSGICSKTSSRRGDDVGLVRNAQFQFPGDAGYSIALDVNGSATIFGDDVVLARNQQLTSLPSGQPSAPELSAVAADYRGAGIHAQTAPIRLQGEQVVGGTVADVDLRAIAGDQLADLQV